MIDVESIKLYNSSGILGGTHETWFKYYFKAEPN